MAYFGSQYVWYNIDIRTDAFCFIKITLLVASEDRQSVVPHGLQKQFRGSRRTSTLSEEL